MTGCLLAHVNTSGVHIPIWLDSEGAIGWGQNSSYPFQEGSFFGNIFVSPPKGYFCNGKDFSAGTVPGRLGVGQSNAPYIRSVRHARPVRLELHRLVGEDQQRRRRLLDLLRLHPRRDRVAQLRRQHAVLDLRPREHQVYRGRGQQHLERRGGPDAHLQRREQPALDDHPDVDRQVQGRQRRDRQGAGSQRSARPPTTLRWCRTATRARRRSSGLCRRWATRAMAASTKSARRPGPPRASGRQQATTTTARRP